MWHKAKQLNTLKWTIYDLLNRRGLRFFLATLSTILTTLRMGKACKVSYRGAWIQRFPSATLVEPRMTLWTPEEIKKWADDLWLYQYRPSEGDTVIDVGAGTGWETLLFSRAVGKSGRVISIEAHPKTFACLSKMCANNRLDNVTLIQAAVGNQLGDVQLSDSDDHEANSISGDGPGIRVPGTTLAEIFRSLSLSRVDFLKMNIEGAETLALSGSGDMIQNTRMVCISCHDFLADEGGPSSLRTKSTIIRFLEQNGFALSIRASDPRENVRDFVYGVNKKLVTHAV